MDILRAYLIRKRDIFIDIYKFNTVFNNSQDARVASHNYCQLQCTANSLSQVGSTVICFVIVYFVDFCFW